MAKQKGGHDGGSVTLLRPDGTPVSRLALHGRRSPRSLGRDVDGNDNVWISNFAMPNSPITQLCGARTENCPPGMKTGDQISPPGGYVGGGLQMQTDLADRPGGRRLGDEQLAGHRQLFRRPERSALDPLRRPGRHDLLRHGQAGPRAADRTGACALAPRVDVRVGSK